jgi:hypothetical protein
MVLCQVQKTLGKIKIEKKTKNRRKKLIGGGTHVEMFS